MKITHHGLGYTGFFGEFKPDVLVQSLRPLLANSETFFSIRSNQKEESVINVDWAIGSDRSRIEPENDSEKNLQTLSRQIATIQWTTVWVSIAHRVRQRSGIPWLLNAQPDESLEVNLEAEFSSIQMDCRLREQQVSRTFLEEVVRNLDISDKPTKHSREIPQALETQLLCDSMHLCNVCRAEGVIIHHMKSVEDGGKTVEENLTVLCLTHHRQAHSKSQLTKNLTETHLREYKSRHAEWVNNRGQPESFGITNHPVLPD